MSNRRGAGEGTISPRWRRDPRTGERRQTGWVARLELGRGPDGRRRRLALYGRTRREVAAALAEALRDRARGVLPTAPAKVTVEAWLRTWLERISPRVRPSTYEHYAWLVNRHLIPALGRRPLGRLTPSDVEAVLAQRLASGLSPRSCAHLRAVLRNALKAAERDGLVSRNVAALAEAPHVPERELRVLTPAQVQQFRSVLAGQEVEPLFLLALGLGLRLGEVLGLRWRDLDLEAGELRVAVALRRVPEPERPGRRRPVLVEPKSTASRRTLPLPRPLVEVLRAHRARQVRRQLEAGSRWRNAWDLVFTDGRGDPLEPTWVLARLHAILAAAGLPRLRFHDLRHSAASLLLAANVPAKVIAEILGHSSVSLTLRTYAHVSSELRALALEAQTRLLGG